MTTTAPTTTSTTVPKSEGPITTPAWGRDLRAALMNAARARLQTTSKFVVHQPYVQGSAVLADLEPTFGGKRRLVGFRSDSSGAWTATWSADIGHEAPESLRAALPQASEALIAKLVWTGKTPITTADILRLIAPESRVTDAKVTESMTIGDWAAANLDSEHAGYAGALFHRTGTQWKLEAIGSQMYERSQFRRAGVPVRLLDLLGARDD